MMQYIEELQCSDSALRKSETKEEAKIRAIKEIEDPDIKI
jgi:hypothetical protein